MVPVSPANTVTAVPLVVLSPVEMDRPLLASLSKPSVETVAVSPSRALTQVLSSRNVAAMRVLAIVQLTPLSSGMVNVPDSPLPLTGTAPPPASRTHERAVV